MSATYTDLPFTIFPDSIQGFGDFYDITSTDAPYVKGYQQAMQNGDTALANTYYNQIPNARSKLITSDMANAIAQTIIALQRFYTTGVQPYITEQQAYWLSKFNQFSYIGDYSSSTRYLWSNIVSYTVNGDKLLFINQSDDTPVGTVPTNTTYWRQFTIKGNQGASGSGASFRYAWDSGTTYAVNDIVSYNNTLWACIVANTNQIPVSGSTYWKSIYSASQVAYPYQAIAPTSPTTGDLWFEVSN